MAAGGLTGTLSERSDAPFLIALFSSVHCRWPAALIAPAAYLSLEHAGTGNRLDWLATDLGTQASPCFKPLTAGAWCLSLEYRLIDQLCQAAANLPDSRLVRAEH